MYVIFEMQTTGGQTAIVTPASYADRNEAESAYHLKLGSAAISSVEAHTVVMLDERGTYLRGECYEHEV